MRITGAGSRMSLPHFVFRPMNAREFFEKVVEMRKCQRNYYAARRTKDADGQREWLSKSLAIETEIDNEITRVHNIQAQQQIK